MVPRILCPVVLASFFFVHSLVVVAGYQPVVYPNKSGLCSKLGCWWFQWGSLGFLEFSGACEFQEGGVEVAVLRCLVSGASTGSGSSVPPFRYGPIVVYSEFQALVGICAVAGGRTFVVRPFFLEASAWGSQLYRLVTHVLTGAFLWSSILRAARS